MKTSRTVKRMGIDTSPYCKMIIELKGKHKQRKLPPYELPDFFIQCLLVAIRKLNIVYYHLETELY